jgi:hypothetical protein
LQRASLESISTVEVIPSDSLASVNDCQQRHQARVQPRRVINSDSWELDVAGVNRHLLKIVLLHDFQLPNWADDDHLRLPTSKICGWCIGDDTLQVVCKDAVTMTRRDTTIIGGSARRRAWMQSLVHVVNTFLRRYGDGKLRAARLTGAVGERRWSCIRSFQKAGNCKVGLSNGSG